MKTFKKFLKEAKGVIFDLGKDGSDPDILISGYGRLTYKALKRSIIKDLEMLTDRTKRLENFDSLNTQIYGKNSVLQTKLEALLDVEKELQTPQTKRKITLLKQK
jgi:hypothetical protein